MLTWLKTAWDGIRGLFGGKGATQIGSRNKALTAVTVGDQASGVTIGNEVHIHHAPPPEPKTREYEPTPAEIEILLALASSTRGYLNAVPFDGGFDVDIDGKALGGQAGPRSSVSLREAVDRLHQNGLIIDMDGDRRLFHLSTSGRAAAKQIRELMAGFDRPDYAELERLMPDLLAEMKADYAEHPLIREMIVLDREGNCYNGGDVFMYYRSRHPNLISMLQILENHGLLQNITYNSVDRYRVTEQFARYLTGR